MAPSHPLLRQLCGALLIALVATAASAAAPIYGPGEVSIEAVATPQFTTRAAQIARCGSMGGSLVPMVTDAVYTMVSNQLGPAYGSHTFAYLGGSSLNSAKCLTYAPSLRCLWSWDQGRYAGTTNSVGFYLGNRAPSALDGAHMVGTTVSNYWGTDSSGAQIFPGDQMQRYAALLWDSGSPAYWADSSDTTWSYASPGVSRSYVNFCAIDKSTTTGTAALTSSSAESEEDSEESTPTSPTAKEDGGVNLPMMIVVTIGGIVAAGLFVVLFVCLAWCLGCCCFARPKDDAAVTSQHGETSATDSVHSCRTDLDETGSRSFYDGGVRSKDGRSSRSSSVRDVEEDDVEVWRGCDDEMTSVASSRYEQTAPAALTAASPAPPPGVTMTMTIPSEMMPMPPQVMTMPPPMMPAAHRAMSVRDSWRSLPASQSGVAPASDMWNGRVRSRSSSVNFAI